MGSVYTKWISKRTHSEITNAIEAKKLGSKANCLARSILHDIIFEKPDSLLTI